MASTWSSNQMAGEQDDDQHDQGDREGQQIDHFHVFKRMAAPGKVYFNSMTNNVMIKMGVSQYNLDEGGLSPCRT